MNKFISKSKNMSLKSKLAMVYILAGFLPVLIIIIVNFLLVRSNFRSNEINNFTAQMNQAVSMAANNLKIYDDLSEYISNDSALSSILAQKYDDDKDFYLKFENMVKPLLESVRQSHNDIESLTLYIEGSYESSDGLLRPLTEISSMQWYKEMEGNARICWYADSEKKHIIIAKKSESLNENGIEGIICIELDYDIITEPFKKLSVYNYGVIITDKNNNIIHEYDAFRTSVKDYILHLDDVIRENNEDDGEYRIIKKSLGTPDWNIWLYKPEHLMTSSINKIAAVTVAGIIMCMLAAFMCIRFTAIFVTKRISRLQNTMSMVEKEDFSVMLESNSKDEIGELIRSFSKMQKKLNHLINEVYKSKISEKEYEMKALQAQINPHFLYNTLSLINWKAIEAGQKDISRITLALSAFYRTSLNKGSNIIPLSGEIENMRSYLSIQLMLHDYNFDVEEDIDESVLKYPSLNLILQPLIENAIEHGIDVLQDGRRGKITVKAKDSGDVIKLSVTDNGMGMTAEQAGKIITSESKGYGVRNVNERIKLYFGEEYTLAIKSKTNVGTEVIITIPKKTKI